MWGMQQLVICFLVFETPLAAAVYLVVISCLLSAANNNNNNHKHVDDMKERTSATRRRKSRRHFVDCGCSSWEKFMWVAESERLYMLGPSLG